MAGDDFCKFAVRCGNLPMGASSVQLQDLFELRGVKDMIDTYVPRGTRVGFVRFARQDAAQRALETVDTLSMEGNQLDLSLSLLDASTKPVSIWFNKLPAGSTNDDLELVIRRRNVDNFSHINVMSENCVGHVRLATLDDAKVAFGKCAGLKVRGAAVEMHMLLKLGNFVDTVPVDKIKAAFAAVGVDHMADIFSVEGSRVCVMCFCSYEEAEAAKAAAIGMEIQGRPVVCEFACGGGPKQRSVATAPVTACESNKPAATPSESSGGGVAESADAATAADAAATDDDKRAPSSSRERSRSPADRDFKAKLARECQKLLARPIADRDLVYRPKQLSDKKWQATVRMMWSSSFDLFTSPVCSSLRRAEQAAAQEALKAILDVDVDEVMGVAGGSKAGSTDHPDDEESLVDSVKAASDHAKEDEDIEDAWSKTDEPVDSDEVAAEEAVGELAEGMPIDETPQPLTSRDATEELAKELPPQLMPPTAKKKPRPAPQLAPLKPEPDPPEQQQQQPLAEIVADYQKRSMFHNKLWQFYVEANGFRTMDPRRHDEAFLESFLDTVDFCSHTLDEAWQKQGQQARSSSERPEYLENAPWRAGKQKLHEDTAATMRPLDLGAGERHDGKPDDGSPGSPPIDLKWF